MILAQHNLARGQIDGWFDSRQLKPQVYAEVEGNEAIVSMVGLGCGVGIVPELVYSRSPLRSQVRILPVEHNLIPYRVGICGLTRRLKRQVVRAFWDLAEQARHISSTQTVK